MLTIDGREFRNLEDQVGYLTAAFQSGKLIDELGIRVLGVFPTIKDAKAALPGPYEYGDAFSIGTVAPYSLYIYTRNIKDFFNFGPFPAPGPQGEKGEKGDKGDKGDRGEQGIQGRQGFQGMRGPQGERGLRGFNGKDGAQGPKGDYGPSFNVRGILESSRQLPTPTEAMQDAGDAYVIPNTEGTKEVWIIRGPDNGSYVWFDLGPAGVQGAQGPTGPAGAGIDTLTATTRVPDVVTYDTTNGITIEGTETATYNNQTHQSDYTDHIPLKPGNGILMDAEAAGDTVIVKIDPENIFNSIGITNIVFKHRVPALQSGHNTLDGYFVNVNDGDATEKEIVTYRPATEGKAKPSGTGVLLTNTPTQAYHAVNKRYADGKFVEIDRRKGLGLDTAYVRQDGTGNVIQIFIRTNGTPTPESWQNTIAGYTSRATLLAADPTEAQDLVTLNYFNNNVPINFKTLFGNQSIKGTGNIDLYQHSITITLKKADTAEEVSEADLLIYSSKNLPIDSLTDLKTILGNSFKVPATGVYNSIFNVISVTANGINAIQSSGVQLIPFAAYSTVITDVVTTI